MNKLSLMTLALAGSLIASTSITAADTTTPPKDCASCDSVHVAQKPFTDVEVDNPYAYYISDLKQQSVLSGAPDGSFGPSNSLTRAQFAVMLVKAFHLPMSTNPVKFDDSKTHWGKSYIQSAFEAGIVAGTSTSTFEPEGTLTREQAAAMVMRYLLNHGVKPASATVNLTPDSTDTWAAENVKNVLFYSMVGPNEVTQQSSGFDYASKKTMTRQSAAALLDLGLRVLNQANLPASTKTYENHAGSQLSPVSIVKGMIVYFKPNGVLNSTTQVTDILNPTDDPTNIIHDTTTNTYSIGNIGLVNVVNVADPTSSSMKTFTDTMNDGAKLISQVTFTISGDDADVKFPSTSGTNYVFKYYDRNGQVQVVTSSTLHVPGMNIRGDGFSFFVDNSPTTTITNVFGKVYLTTKDTGSFSSNFATIDIN